ncbi:MAG: CBS domain-containing protein [Chloroflexaceae bacterium]|nr:CBS domain-containing protein [Chloroflexaceae bacterium]NJO06874.1 CBS domain-containing protein [Chloroflexaceae bacterium]
MQTVRQVLKDKQRRVWSVSADTSVADAVKVMTEKDVGAIMVIEAEQVVGIITERDCVRKVIGQGRAADATPVKEIMTPRVLYVRPEQTMEDCMVLMNQRHLRHLPVFDNEQLVGMVSIRDAIKYVIDDREFIIEQLENYILNRPSWETRQGISPIAPIVQDS